MIQKLYNFFNYQVNGRNLIYLKIVQNINTIFQHRDNKSNNLFFL